MTAHPLGFLLGGVAVANGERNRLNRQQMPSQEESTACLLLAWPRSLREKLEVFHAMDLQVATERTGQDRQNTEHTMCGFLYSRWCQAQYSCLSGVYCRGQDGTDMRRQPLLDLQIKNQASMGLACTGPCEGSHRQQLSNDLRVGLGCWKNVTWLARGLGYVMMALSSSRLARSICNYPCS
ncbi:hypothetical protein BT67DRAFT_438014 [Trichocladium antarcticum]|uniref:Uncharacterized protein n=1 Tax=Trichocladium antarcticum TaxID=1450529 RepID=A0AAN6UTL9_9PEZI|nr:hypothetical protein BT67DRAFT_438014 [Trichocladium antarcticum]